MRREPPDETETGESSEAPAAGTGAGTPAGHPVEAEAARLVIGELVRDAGIEVRYPQRRRSSDILLVVLAGEREQVLALPLAAAEALPELDLEIVRSGRRGKVYELTLAVTERIEAQEFQMPERRAKLRRRIDQELKRS